MLAFVITRLFQAAGVMLVMSAVVFVGVYSVGNPMDLLVPPEADHAIRAAVTARYGLDKPLWQQYFVFLGNLLHGDLGRSFIYNLPTLDLILSRAPATLELALSAVIGATVVGILLGIYAGYRPDGILAKLIMGLSILGFSVPTFWVGLILILTFAVQFRHPAGRRTRRDRHHFRRRLELSDAERPLPSRLTGPQPGALQARHADPPARAGTREAMLADYVNLRAAGLSERIVLLRHVLKNIAIPIVTVFGLELGSTIAFAVVTETIFSWPGMGKLIIDSDRRASTDR